MSFAEEVEVSLLEMGINVHDYESYTAARYAEALSTLKSISMLSGVNVARGLAA